MAGNFEAGLRETPCFLTGGCPVPHGVNPSRPGQFSALAVTGVLSELILLPRQSPQVAPRGSLLGSVRGRDLTPALMPHCQPECLRQPHPDHALGAGGETALPRRPRRSVPTRPGGGTSPRTKSPPHNERPELQRPAPPRPPALPGGESESEVVWFVGAVHSTEAAGPLPPATRSNPSPHPNTIW